jgi:hypothetical protein
MKQIGAALPIFGAHTPTAGPVPLSAGTAIAQPWFKLDAEHILSDLGFRECSLAARGVFLGLLCLMHKGHPYGHLARGGKALDYAQVAKGLGCRAKEVMKALDELWEADVLRQTQDGVFYSSYLIEIAAKTSRAHYYGKKGGNPNLKARDREGVKPPLNRG